jgi:hypothetical protein
MKACAAGYAVTYITTLNYSEIAVTQLNGRILTALKNKPILFPVPSLSLSNNTYIWIYII